MTTLLVRSQSLTGYIPLTRSLGADPAQLLRQHGISPHELANEDGFVPYASLIHLLEATARVTGRGDFGLLLSTRQTIEVLGPLAIIARNSATVGDALRAIGRNLEFYTPAVLNSMIEEGPELIRYRIDINVPHTPHRAQTIDLTLAFALDVFRILAGRDCIPQEVSFRHQAEIPASVYGRYFRCPTRFSQPSDSLSFKREIFDRAIGDNDQLLHQTVDDYVATVIARRPHDLQGQVKLLVRRMLATDQCTLGTIAANLSMHERTLQRRLRDEGVCFDDLVEATRRDCAVEYLGQRHIRMSQVASMVGYVEQSSFNRSCRRWFGVTPMQARRQVQAGLSPGIDAASLSGRSGTVPGAEGAHCRKAAG